MALQYESTGPKSVDYSESSEGKSEVNPKRDLVARTANYFRQLAPHMMQREGVLLLRESKEDIERLRAILNKIVIRRADGTIIISQEDFALHAAAEYVRSNS